LKKEDRLSIISLLLEVSSINSCDRTRRQDSIPPNIMYNTLLNNPRLKEYWTDLTELGLLEYDITTNTFKTTEKGLRFLEVFSELDQRAREEQQEKKKKKNGNHSISKVSGIEPDVATISTNCGKFTPLQR
jgi:predicted transcriptional regulator